MKRSFFVLALALTRHFMKPRYPIVALVGGGAHVHLDRF